MTIDPPEAQPERQKPLSRAQVSRQVAGIIARRASAAGMSSAKYFREIIAGRAPRISRAEADREPVT
jgi:hypothetical protein